MKSTTIPLSAITPETLNAISFVGRIVTFDHAQYLCYDVEGYDYYAFVSGPDEITVDWAMKPSECRSIPKVGLLPVGTSIGDGYRFEVRLTSVRKGTALAKRGIPITV